MQLITDIRSSECQSNDSLAIFVGSVNYIVLRLSGELASRSHHQYDRHQ